MSSYTQCSWVLQFGVFKLSERYIRHACMYEMSHISIEIAIDTSIVIQCIIVMYIVWYNAIAPLYLYTIKMYDSRCIVLSYIIVILKQYRQHIPVDSCRYTVIINTIGRQIANLHQQSIMKAYSQLNIPSIPILLSNTEPTIAYLSLYYTLTIHLTHNTCHYY